MGTNLICKSYGYRCTPSMKCLGLLRYDMTALFYHIIVEALESLLWFWYIYGIMCLASFICFYILRFLLFSNYWFFDISSWLYGLDFVWTKVFGLELILFRILFFAKRDWNDVALQQIIHLLLCRNLPLKILAANHRFFMNAISLFSVN